MFACSQDLILSPRESVVDPEIRGIAASATRRRALASSLVAHLLATPYGSSTPESHSQWLRELPRGENPHR